MPPACTGSSQFIFLDAPWLSIYLSVIFLFDRWQSLPALSGAVRRRRWPGQPALVAAGRPTVAVGGR